MEHKVCYYCGTKYDAEEERCPLCGETAVEEEPEQIQPAVQTAPSESEPKQKVKANKKTNAIAVVICIVLALAVVGGALFFLHSLGFLSIGEPAVDNTSLNLPVETETVACTGIRVSPEQTVFTGVGQKELLTVTCEPANCTEQVTYESADPGVASVTADGEIMAVGTGTTSITVTCGEFAKAIPVTCNLITENPDNGIPEITEVTAPEPAPPQKETETAPTGSFTIQYYGEDREDISINSAEERIQLSVSSGSAAWESKDPGVVRVEDGLVTPVGVGVTKVIATVDGKTAECIVRCNVAAAPTAETPVPEQQTSGRALESNDVTVSVGETFRMNLLENGKRVSGVSWHSTNEAVCTVDASGKVTCTGGGMAKIIGTVDGQSYECIVRGPQQ